MNALQNLLPLLVALVGAGIVWWAQRTMRRADDELHDFALRADLHLGR